MAADLVIVPAEVFPTTAAGYIAEAIVTASKRVGRVSVALSGGRGPRPVYHRLSGWPGLPWQRVEIYFVDERAVSPENEESNYRLVNETLLAGLSVDVAAVFRMEGERGDLERAAEEYESALPARLDLLVLGMGEDGHTASLFPRHPAVSEGHRRVLAIEGPHPPRRLTITPPVIRAARARLMLVAGANKAPAVARALSGPHDPIACPAQLARDGVWILDEQAASRLPAGAG